MNAGLLDAFMNEDCERHIVALLWREVCEPHNRGALQSREYTFNQFNLLVDFASETVRIDDEFDPSESGTCKVSLPQFRERLRSLVSV